MQEAQMRSIDHVVAFITFANVFVWFLAALVFAGKAYVHRLPSVPWSNTIILDENNFTPTGKRYRMAAIVCIVCWLLTNFIVPRIVTLALDWF